eukprot:TRINITY_DN6102_c0_g1_i7.p1 TRINITY_DN6102_c0_g1~~TRINITY_DN6102_c0_g1_i7.p1  ORF type:complete len:345 (-),score=57.44 TRINITY_DN6102_c0_g1_i7:216-1250(-)
MSDFDAYFAREDDDSIVDSAQSRDDGSNDEDDADMFPRRTETIYDLDAYFARRQTGVVDGRGNDGGIDFVVDDTRRRNGSGDDEDVVPLFPLRTEIINALADGDGRKTSAADGKGDDVISDFAARPWNDSNVVSLDEHFSQRQTRVSDGRGGDQGDDRTPNGLRIKGGSGEDEAPSDPLRTGTMAEVHAMLDAKQVHVVESLGGGEGQGAMYDALRRPFPPSSSSNATASAPASSSYQLARSDRFGDAADFDMHRRSWIVVSSRPMASLREDLSSSSARAPEFGIAGAQVALEQDTSEAAALARSVQVDMVEDGLSVRIADDIAGAQRESIIAMARARRRPAAC